MKQLRPTILGLAALAVLAAAHAPMRTCADDFGFRVGVGGEYSSGDYGGQESINETYLPVNFIYDAPRVTARVTVPYLSVRAPEGTITEGPDGEIVVGEGPVTTESGIGDVLAALTVYDVLVLGQGDYAMDLTGKVKFGTADEDDGLGTGENDYSIEANLFRFFDRFTLLGVGGYVVRGDPPEVDLQNGVLRVPGRHVSRDRSGARRTLLRLSGSLARGKRRAAGDIGHAVVAIWNELVGERLRAGRHRRRIARLGCGPLAHGRILGAAESTVANSAVLKARGI